MQNYPNLSYPVHSNEDMYPSLEMGNEITKIMNALRSILKVPTLYIRYQ